MKKTFNIVKIIFLLFLSKNLYANEQYHNDSKPLYFTVKSDTIVINGKIKYFLNGWKSVGAEVAFINLDKVYFSNRTNESGEYQIRVPSEKVFNKNVISINYSSSFYLFKSDYHIIETRFSTTKRLEVGVDNLSKISYINPNVNDLIYIEGKQVYISSLNEFDPKGKFMQYVIKDSEIIKNLCGETSKKRLILYFLYK